MNAQWEDSLRSERYPFAGTGLIISDSGLVLPDDTFLDLNLMVQNEDFTVLLSKVEVDGISAIFTFATDAGVVGTYTSTDAETETMPVKLGTATVGYARVDLASTRIVRGWPQGTHTFSDVSVIPHLLVISDPKWRRGLRLPDGSILEGDVYLVADRGVWFERTMTGFKAHVTGDPFDGRVHPSRGILTINGETPTNGNINLIGLGSANLASGFTADALPFRINIIPGTGSVTISLTGAM